MSSYTTAVSCRHCGRSVKVTVAGPYYSHSFQVDHIAECDCPQRDDVLLDDALDRQQEQGDEYYESRGAR